MGKIKKILENELVGGTQGTDVYPVTSTKAVYNEDNKRLDDVLRRNMPINISTEYNDEHVAEVLTLSQSVNKVASKDRTLGFQGKYLSADGWHTIIYTGDSLTTWTDSTKWVDLNDKIFNSISKNATFAGIATPTTNPGTPDGPVFYIATELGDYSNFGGINIEEGEATILEWDNRVWSKRVTGFATQEKLTKLESDTNTKITELESQTNTKITELELETNTRITELGQEINGSKLLTWTDGYIDKLGLINSSEVSKFTQPFLLKAGQSVTIGTDNKNICMIGKTTADSLSVGDTITVIYTTSGTSGFVSYTYTATKDTMLVLCVKWSDYSLSFYDPESVEGKIDTIESKLETELVSYEITHANYDAYDGNKVWDSQQIFPIGSKLIKLKIASTGTQSAKNPIIYIVDSQNNIEESIKLYDRVGTSDTDFDLTQYNIVVKEGYKYLVEACSNAYIGSELTGRYFYLTSKGLMNYDKYYFGFAFTYAVENDRLKQIENKIEAEAERLDEIEIVGVGLNLFNKFDDDIVRNKAFDKATGNLVDFPNAFITGFIPVEYGKKYSFTDETSFLGSTYNRSVSIYDAEKNFIEGYFYDVTHTDNVINTFTCNNQSAKYAKVVGYYARIGSFMFVEGDILPSKYAPFGEYKYLNPALFPSDYPFIRMFRKVAGLGDSLMSGCIQKSRTDAHDFNNVSWLSFISYDSGAIAKHYSTGGFTAKNWIDGNGGHKEKLASDPKSWAYFIGFGTNDADSSKASYPLGKVSDAAGTDSFVGYYKQIIEYVHTQAPNAKIFCMSTYRRSEPYGVMVGEIAKLYSYCYYIDIIACSDVTLFSDSRYVSFDHFTTQGYLALAKNIAKEVNRIIADNMQDFIYVGYDNN